MTMTAKPAHEATSSSVSAPHEGELKRNLKNRHIQMIALGGAIGTGLFYGAGSSIGMAGPSIIAAYLVGGAAIFLIMRALGEMSVHTPVAGAFSHYAAKNWGKFAGFFTGWNYWFCYIAVSMAELSVVGIYINYWLPGIPTWVSAGVFLVIITAINLINVKAYGEFEFWFAIIKVVAIVAMIVFGLAMAIFGLGLDAPTGISNLWAHGGFLPNGLWGMLTALVLVMFSFGGVELIGITAGEADNPARSIPKAINQVVYRILIFYVGAIFVLLALFPWNKVGQDGSPFVIIFDRIGIVGAATILNVVVLTAALSAYNSGLYSNGRMLYSLAKQGQAPKVLARTSASGSPYAGVLASSAVTAIAVVLNYVAPKQVFMVLMSIATIAAILNWAVVLITQLKFRRRIGAEAADRLSFKMPLFPVANYVVLAFLAFVVFLMTTMDGMREAVFIGAGWIVALYIAFRVVSAARRTTAVDEQKVPTTIG